MNEAQQRRARLWAAAQSDDDLLAALAENSALRAQLAALREERATLYIRLDASLARERELRAHRPLDLRGAMCAFWDWLNGRV